MKQKLFDYIQSIFDVDLLDCQINEVIDIVNSDRNQQLIDHFASLAMQGMVSSDDFFSISNENICKNAYDIAEAMMKERERRMKE